MTRHSSEGNSALIPTDSLPVDLSVDTRASKALSKIKEKYPHALTDQAWRRERKIGVLIDCTFPGCSAQRFVHSSDLFQTKTCTDHRKRASKPVAEKAKRGVRSKNAPKGGRKAPKARKGSPRARKAKTTVAAASAE